MSCATLTNAVQVLPLQRSTVIDVALKAVLIHVRLIRRRVLELATSCDGAAGGSMTDVEAVAVLE